MRPRSLTHPTTLATAAMGIAFAGGACTSLTSSDEFKVGGLCSACPARPDLRHVPCRSGQGPAAGDGGVYFYALRSIDLGANPSQWTGSYAIGLDQDCSDRPDGGPVLCASVNPVNWVSLPNGVDNSLAAQTFATVFQGVRWGDSIQQNMNAALNQGTWGLLLVVDHWNGTPEDNDVGVRLLYTSPYPDGGLPPRWDGTDQWYPYTLGPDAEIPEVPDSDTKGGSAYVTGGQLVWDGTKINGASIRLENNATREGWGAVEIGIANLAFLGSITPDGITNASLSGVWPTSIAHLYPEFLLGGDHLDGVCAIRNAFAPYSGLKPFWTGAVWSDMPTPGFSGASSVNCTSVSFGFGMEFVRSSSVYTPNSEPPPAATYSPFACDAGADGG